MKSTAELLGNRRVETAYFAVRPDELWASAESAVIHAPSVEAAAETQLGVNELCLALLWGLPKREYIGRRWNPCGDDDLEENDSLVEDNPFVASPPEHLLHLLAGKTKYLGVAWQRRLYRALPQLGIDPKNARRLVLGRRLDLVAVEHGLNGWDSPEWRSWLPLAEGRARVIEHGDAAMFRRLVDGALSVWHSASEAPPEDLRSRLFRPSITQEVVVLSLLGQLSIVVEALEAGLDVLIGNADTEATAWEGTGRDQDTEGQTWLVDLAPRVGYFAVAPQSRRAAVASAMRSYPVQDLMTLDQAGWQAQLAYRLCLPDSDSAGLAWHYILPLFRTLDREVRYLGFGWEGFGSEEWLAAMGVSRASASFLLHGEEFLLRDRTEDPTLPTTWAVTVGNSEVRQPLPVWPETMRLISAAQAPELRELVGTAITLYCAAGPEFSQRLGIEPFDDRDDRTVLVMLAFASYIVEVLEDGADVLVCGSSG